MTEIAAIDKLIGIAAEEVGYLEKRSGASLDDKTANAGSGNYTKYWRDIYPEYQGEPWCACFVTWCFVKAFGREKAAKLLKHYPFVYCPTLGGLAKLNADPKRGDIVLFCRGGKFAHTGIVTSVNGDYFTTIEGNTSGAGGIIANGGGVCKKGYYNSSLPGTKFVTVDWSIAEGEEADMEELKDLRVQTAELKALLSAQKERYDLIINKIGREIEELRRQNAALQPVIYDYIDDNMPEWAREGVRYCVDNGIINGVGNGRLGLDDKDLKYCTMIMRMMNKINRIKR